jgi:hypothetical protein
MPTVVVHGLREIELLAKSKGREASRTLNKELRAVAEPIRSDAERLATSNITRIGPRWGKMRVGVTQRLVYVAPKERGVKGRGDLPRRRPRFADLMQARAMQPALTQNSAFVLARVDAVFTKFVNDWNRS